MEIKDISSTNVVTGKVAMNKNKALMLPPPPPINGGVQNMSFDSGEDNSTSSPRSHEIVIAVDFKERSTTGNEALLAQFSTFPFFNMFNTSKRMLYCG